MSSNLLGSIQDDSECTTRAGRGPAPALAERRCPRRRVDDDLNRGRPEGGPYESALLFGFGVLLNAFVHGAPTLIHSGFVLVGNETERAVAESD